MMMHFDHRSVTKEIGLIAILVFLGVAGQANPATVLSIGDLVAIRGNTTTCDNCTYDDRRLDECYHESTIDDCSTDACIENLLVEDTCSLSEVGACGAETNVDLDESIRYHRSDSNCQTNNPLTWQIWTKHYYSEECLVKVFKSRCQKPTNNCNGTLVSITTIKNGIECK